MAQLGQQEQPRLAEVHFFLWVDGRVVLGFVLGAGPDLEVAGVLLLVEHSLWRECGHHCSPASDLVDLGNPASQLVHVYLHILLLFNSVLDILFRGHHAVYLHAFQNPL